MAAAAAAAAFSRSRGVSGVRTTKGLILLFTLLCLVCLTSSRMDKDELKKLKEKLKKAEKVAEKLKENMGSSSKHLSEPISLMNQAIEFTKKAMKAYYTDLPPLDIYMDKVKGFIEKTKTYLDKKDEELAAKIEDNEKTLEEIKKYIKILEENHGEL